MTVWAPPADAREEFARIVEESRRLTGLRVNTLALAVTAPDDLAGWTRLSLLGTQATTDAQSAAVAAVADLMGATLESAGASLGPVRVPITVGTLPWGQSVWDMFAQTQQVVRNRMFGGATFPEARAASATYLVKRAASEPHRIGRDGQLGAGLADPRFTKVRRVAESGACHFCRMLATRGAVYLNEQTAGKYSKYHDLCRCDVVTLADDTQIADSKSLSSDWHNAIRDESQMRAAGAMSKPRPRLNPVSP